MMRANRPVEVTSRPLSSIGRLGLAVAFGIGFAGCSDSGSPVTSRVAPNTAITTSAPTLPATTVEATEPPPPPSPVVVKVTTRVGDREVSDEVTLAPETTSDPFGRFATCSGAWDSFGAYNVLVSNPDPAVGSVQISSVDNVRRSGRTKATARIEWGDGFYVSTGILEFGDDFRGGVFGGKTADGLDVSVNFACESDRVPTPIDRTRQFVDVAALLSKDGKERIVSTGSADGCDGGVIDLAEDPNIPFSLGAISAVTISPDAMALRIGDRQLEFESQVVSPRDATSGTFTAQTIDGISVTGAYYCRQ